ncbi:MAG TPA: hypothetical protein VFI28_01865 [Candidatus Limnocylindrales bacterium]|nr:hypothetical protein [Candidatus Limnocylindrales bacterium]
MITKLLIAGFLLAHGAIHSGFISPRPAATAGGPAWPFELTRSWILSPLGIDPETTRLVGTALVAATVAGFALAALGTLGLLPESAWAPALVVGAVASLGLLALFFHPWLVVGIGIDALLLWAAIIVSWTPSSLGG